MRAPCAVVCVCVACVVAAGGGGAVVVVVRLFRMRYVVMCVAGVGYVVSQDAWCAWCASMHGVHGVHACMGCTACRHAGCSGMLRAPYFLLCDESQNCGVHSSSAL